MGMIRKVEDAHEELIKMKILGRDPRVVFNIGNPKEVFCEAFIDTALAGETWEDRKRKFRWNDDYASVVEWLRNNDGRGLWLTGDVGVGKTVIATRIIPVVYRLLYPSWILPAIIRFWELNIPEQGATIMSRIMNRRLIVFDDLGRENCVNSYAGKYDVIPGIVDYAENTNAMLVVTSNMPEAKLIERYGTPTVDRMYGLCRKVVIRGTSNRKQNI